VVRLIRSKGVGVYFVTQNPLDVPDKVLAQLGNRVQHALRAFTPRDQKAVKAAADTFRQNPKLNTEQVIMELARSARRWSRFLGGKGTPSMVERTMIAPADPARIGPITLEERAAMHGEELRSRANTTPRSITESAYEKLTALMSPKRWRTAGRSSTDGGGITRLDRL
jgi:DNA helicase HerA-like ATPase